MKNFWLNRKDDRKCLVCGKPTQSCPPSPFTPCSYWRCKECQLAKRVSYDDLVRAGTNKSMYDECGKDYFAKRMNATLQFLEVEENCFWQDVEKKLQEYKGANAPTNSSV